MWRQSYFYNSILPSVAASPNPYSGMGSKVAGAGTTCVEAVCSSPKVIGATETRSGLDCRLGNWV